VAILLTQTSMASYSDPIGYAYEEYLPIKFIGCEI